MHRLSKTLLIAAAACLLAAPAAALGGPPASAARTHAVALQHIAIKPKTLRIHRGDSVTWTWGDKPIDAMHNVTSFGKLRFRSGPTQLVGTYTVRFSRKGTYTYHCTIHPGAMEATIVVR